MQFAHREWQAFTTFRYPSLGQWTPNQQAFPSLAGSNCHKFGRFRHLRQWEVCVCRNRIGAFHFVCWISASVERLQRCVKHLLRVFFFCVTGKVISAATRLLSHSSKFVALRFGMPPKGFANWSLRILAEHDQKRIHRSIKKAKTGWLDTQAIQRSRRL